MKKRGISLIVLIITIIVIIILAAVVILTLSKNNPIESAREARFKEDVRTFQDELAMYIAKEYTSSAGQRDGKVSATSYDGIKNYIQSFSKKYEGKFIIQNDELIYQGDSLTENENKWVLSMDMKGIVNPVPKEWRTYIADVTEDGVPIPKGFTYLEGSKEEGTVIEDENHNEFVWIPSTEDEYVKDTNFRKEIKPNGDDMIFELDETVDVKKYGGFYVGRYEATIADTYSNEAPTCKKGSEVWTNINYNDSKIKSESMYNDSSLSIRSGLLTGTAWDRVCHFISDYKIKVNNVEETIDINDSKKYGNYTDSIAPANEGSGIKRTARYNENWKTKNIYDLAGNAWEWTYETSGTSSVIDRGGGYNYGGPVTCGAASSKNNASVTIGFRVRLYIKTD